MWDRVDTLLERAPDARALRLHRVELLEARRRRAAGLAVPPELRAAEAQAVADELAAIPLLTRVRTAWDGPLVLLKGPEVAMDYPAPRLRPFGDLDLLTDDALAAQRALVARGFREVGDPEVYAGIHHLRPLWWPGLPLVVELHTQPKWPDGVPAPGVRELVTGAVPSRLSVPGVSTLPPAEHALVLAAHAWAHQPLGRLGNLIDVALCLERADDGEVAALARRWGCSRMWKATRAAVRAVLHGEGASAGVRLWARQLTDVRERTVLEWHVHELLAPAWGRPWRRVPGAVARAVVAEARPVRREPWRAKFGRARLAMANATAARSEHHVALRARDHDSSGGTERA